MLSAFLLIPFLWGLTSFIIGLFKSKLNWFNTRLAWNIFWYHLLFWIIYYGYTLANRSDSRKYYERSSEIYSNWSSAYRTGTGFIDFVAYPFIQLGFSYEMMMVLFAWFGYLGFLYFYIYFKENSQFKHQLGKYDLIKILLFLPNMHFWTASLGKGSLIFMGMGMAIYGLSKLQKRKIALIAGLLIVYHVRPHVFLFMVLGIVVGLFTGRQKVPAWQKYLVVVGGAVTMFFLYSKILAFAGLDSEDVVGSFDKFADKRAAELSKAGSGVDVSNYPLILKLFTFWFRPLFVDAPGALGIFVSFENLVYVIITAKLFNKDFLPFIFKGPALMKTSLVIFIVASIALSTTMSNLGIIIRQKSQVMYFFFFVVLAFLDWQKQQQFIQRKLRKEKADRMMALRLREQNN